MCGVVAALGEFPDITVPMMLISHRGIRSSIKNCRGGVIGHVRLPIVGVDNRHDQPIVLRNGLLGFVGEILDFREYHPGMECDTELVAEIWKEEGPKGFLLRDGFWGIAAIHGPSQTLHVLTDYLGQKPMYYRADHPSAASEPAALIPFGPVTIDGTYMAAVIKWGYCPDLTRTPYEEIKHVLPGEHVVLDHGGVKSREIVDPLYPRHYTDADMVMEIEAAVKRRVLSSDVPVAALVSGGVDSAIVYTLAQRYGQVVPYYASGSDGDGLEYYRAAHVAHPTKLRTANWRDVTVDDALAIMQEPIDLGSLRPQIALSRAIEERVCLTGDGADEVFGGYPRSLRYDSQHSDIFQELPAWHLPRLDRVMMRERIEVRTPFLARQVVQMALSMPYEMRKDKMRLRTLFSEVLPVNVAFTKKKALRTNAIEMDREGNSRMLVDKFKGCVS